MNRIEFRWRAVALSFLLASSTSTLHGAWLSTVEQRARADFAEGEYEAAARAFRDPYRRGVALYRAGHYRDAARSFASVQRAEVELDARYNLGNAHFQLGDYEQAITAYEAVLVRDPEHDDAEHNLALAERLLAEQQGASHRDDGRRDVSAGDSSTDAMGRRMPAQEAAETESWQAEGEDRERAAASQESDSTSAQEAEQEPHESEKAETSSDASEDREGEETGETQGESSGKGGEEATSSGGGPVMQGSGEMGASSSGGGSDDGTGNEGGAADDQGEGGAASAEENESVGAGIDPLPDGGGGQDAALSDTDQSRSPSTLTEGSPGSTTKGTEGEEEGVIDDGEPSPGKAKGVGVEGPLKGDARAGERSLEPLEDVSGEGDADSAPGVEEADTGQPGGDPKGLRSKAQGLVMSDSKQRAGGEQVGRPGDPQASRAVDRSEFHQLRPMGGTAPGAQSETLGLSQLEQGDLSADPASSALMEAWLDRIGSDPAPLLRARFLFEEEATLRKEGGIAIEPRPW